MAHEVLVVAHAPEPAGPLGRLGRAAGGEPVIADAAPERLPERAALVVAQWPLEPSAELAVSHGGVGLVLVCADEPGPPGWRGGRPPRPPAPPRPPPAPPRRGPPRPPPAAHAPPARA